jgi:tRNA(fMet)-specific endonuclease VapC
MAKAAPTENNTRRKKGKLKLKEWDYRCTDSLRQEAHQALKDEFSAAQDKSRSEKLSLERGIYQGETAEHHCYRFEVPPITAKSVDAEHQPSDIAVSAITVAELEYGCAKSADPGRNRLALIEFLSPLSSLPFDDSAARVYGNTRMELEGKGTPMGAMDLLIASHAKSKSLTVVTSNTREFERIDGLVVVDWA